MNSMQCATNEEGNRIMNTQEYFIDPETGQYIKDNFTAIGDIIKDMNIAGA